MSISYGGPPSGSYPPMSGGEYAPPGRVSYGWIGEAFNLFGRAAGVWIVGVLLYGIFNNVVNGIIVYSLPNPSYIAPPGPFGQSQFHLGLYYGTNSNVTPLGQVLGLLFAWLFGSFQAASLYQVALKQVRGQSVAFGDLFGGGPSLGNVLVLNLILTAFYVAGFVALCVGALVVAAFVLPATAIAADGHPAGQALSESVAGMKKDWLAAVVFLLVIGLVLLASVLPCGLGLFVTIPMVYLIGVLAYRDMVGMRGIGQPSPGYGTAPGVWPPAPGSWPPAPNAAPPSPQWGAPPQQYPNFPPQPYSSPSPPQQYPPETPTQYPPRVEPPPGEMPPPSWQPRPTPPQGE